LRTTKILAISWSDLGNILHGSWIMTPTHKRLPVIQANLSQTYLTNRIN